MRLSLIDLGTNSVRYDAYDIKGGKVVRLHREKRMVRLGDGVFEKGHLNEEAMARTSIALADFAAFNDRFKIEKVRAVTTAAMRGTADAPAALKRFETALGHPLQVLTGDEEASLIADGILFSETTLPSGSYILIDIGGGSTELNLCQGKRRLEGASVDLGANRLQQTFLRAVPPVKGGVQALRDHCHEILANFKSKRQWPEVKELVGSSGSIRALRNLAKASDSKDQPFTTHFVEKLNRHMGDFDRLSLLHLPGMDEKRVDLILAGSLLLETALGVFGAKKVWVTDASLREGLLFQELKVYL